MVRGNRSITHAAQSTATLLFAEMGFEFGPDFVEVELGSHFGVFIVLDFGFGDGQAIN
jgi:hypothetical protein